MPALLQHFIPSLPQSRSHQSADSQISATHRLLEVSMPFNLKMTYCLYINYMYKHVHESRLCVRVFSCKTERSVKA